MTVDLSALFLESLRVLFLIAVPVLVVAVVSGVLASALQSATTLNDAVIGYAVKLLAVVVLMVLFMPVISGLVISLAELAWR